MARLGSLLRATRASKSRSDTEGHSVTRTERSDPSPFASRGPFATLRVSTSAKGTGALSFPRLASLLATIAVTLSALLVALAPASASAYATIEGPPVFSSAPGLPDGRIYEQVSPAAKNGNEAGAGTAPFKVGAKNDYGIASPDGNAVLFEGTGPMGESPSGGSLWFVATKSTGSSGWSTHALLPKVSPQEGTVNEKEFNSIYPSQDLTHAMADFAGGTLSPQANEACRSRINLIGPDPFVTPTMLEQPSPQLSEPIENCESQGNAGAPVGGSPDFSTVYFTYPGTLLPEDAGRTPHARGVGGDESNVEAWGYYEYSGGALHEAGVLPDGEVSPFGAVPAASGHGRNRRGDEISADGTRAFFVSPDPASCKPAGQNDCAADPPELYVRENGDRTQLVSQDALLPAGGTLPAAAPSGVAQMPNPSNQLGQNGLDGSYVFASPDGSQAFFQSEDPLTEAAAEDSPGSAPKTYEFDVSAGTLTYLPDVEGEILATDRDGSAMTFLRPEAGGEPAQLDRWATGPAGGTVTPIVQLAAGVPEARMSNDGSVLVFQTPAQLSGTFNSGGQEQIYRYDVPQSTLGCVSCAPPGAGTDGGASLSRLYENEQSYASGQVNAEYARFPVDARGISANGDRIFFETRTPLVPQDANTNSPPQLVEEVETAPQGRDVYEWENGVVYIISTGQSPRNAFFLDNSENGDDVFFAIAQGLVPGDTDGGYDVYDARVQRAGDSPPPSANPCQGSSCQGAANTLPSAAAAGSAAFSGAGNPTPEVTPQAATSTPPKAVKCKKGYVKSKNKCVKSKPKKKAKKTSNAKRAADNRRAPR
jgi:hypothetical protein